MYSLSKLYSSAIIFSRLSIEDDLIFGNEIYLGYTWYINGIKLDEPKEEKAEDFAKLDEEAHDAYNMNFTLESLRNTGINLTYRSWLYKDATRAVRGGRVPLELPNFEKTLGKIGFKDAGKKLDSKILSTKFGGKFAQYTENEAG